MMGFCKVKIWIDILERCTRGLQGGGGGGHKFLPEQDWISFRNLFSAVARSRSLAHSTAESLCPHYRHRNWGSVGASERGSCCSSPACHGSHFALKKGRKRSDCWKVLEQKLRIYFHNKCSMNFFSKVVLKLNSFQIVQVL